MQLPLFELQSEWRPTPMSEIPDWPRLGRIAIDTETCDPLLRKLGPGARRGGYIVGISFAIEDGPSHYLPIRHGGGDNLDQEKVLAYMRDQASKFEGEIVGANLPYDLDYLWQQGIQFHPKYFRDVQIAAPLINELHDSFSLQAIADRLGLPGKDETLLEQAINHYGVNSKSGLWQLPARFVGAYAEQDVKLPLQILRRQERIIDDEDLWDIYNMESKVLPVLLKMRQRGVLVDWNRLERIEEWSKKEEKIAFDKIKASCGVSVTSSDIWKAAALARVLTAAGIPFGKTEKTQQPSIDKLLLEKADHPAATAILRARKVNKLRTTFAKSLRAHETGGRIHPTFNQMAREKDSGKETQGARYGRLSCVNPNMQQQPSRDEFAAEWRSVYLPEPGMLWASCDYSQQEPRWTTHFATRLDLEGAAQAANRYAEDPTMDVHQFMSDITGLPRKTAKNLFLGLCYGEGGAKLSKQLGLPTRWAMSTVANRKFIGYFATEQEARMAGRTVQDCYIWEAAGEEGQNILDTFNARAPFVRKLAKKVEEKAARKGYIITIGKRKLHFPEKPRGGFDWAHKALNRLIQGSSADQTKISMLKLSEEMPELFMQLQVHDELTASVPDVATAQKMARIMETSVPAKLPFRVDVETGPSWGESK